MNTIWTFIFIGIVLWIMFFSYLIFTDYFVTNEEVVDDTSVDSMDY